MRQGLDAWGRTAEHLRVVSRPAADPLASSLGRYPVATSTATQGGIGAVWGALGAASLGAVVAPAHVGLMALAGASAGGAAGAVKGYHDGKDVARFLRGDAPVSSGADASALPPGFAPSPAEQAHDVFTSGTGSWVLDAALGAGIGYALVPAASFALVGALLAGLGGVAGIGLLAGYRLATR